MGLGHGSFGQELWLGLFSVVAALNPVKHRYAHFPFLNTFAPVTHSYHPNVSANSIANKILETRGGKTFWLKYQYVIVPSIL